MLKDVLKLNGFWRRRRVPGRCLQGLATTLAALLFFPGPGIVRPAAAAPVPSAIQTAAPNVAAPRVSLTYGFDPGRFHIRRDRIRAGQTLSSLLSSQGVSYGDLQTAIHLAVSHFDLRRIRVGRSYAIITPIQDTGRPPAFVYEISDTRYLVVDFNPPISVSDGQKPITIVNRHAEVTIQDSLWQSVSAAGLDPKLIAALSDIFSWRIDFRHLKAGDAIDLVYEERWLGNHRLGVGHILGARLTHNGTDLYAYYLDDGPLTGYYDGEGNSLKKTFLKAPVRFARITSRYSLRRFHPILKIFCPHLGTDFAAPAGTPVMSTADGVISRMGRTHNDGNFIKIRHSRMYSTQYLHLKSFAKGMRVGRRVHQGEVIGAVGSTGLATGPHVCYRFWKSGRQVDPFKLTLPPARRLPADEIRRFTQWIRPIRATLDADNTPRLAQNTTAAIQ